tara:strand:+ start:510 stop:1103 length:594 start_codon:yes stop_codon:yes gene_type:complete
MKISKSNKVQLILIFVGFILIILTYYYYPNLNKNKYLEDQSLKDDEINKIKDDQSTLFENVKYRGLYNLDKTFTVESEQAYISNDEPDVVFMTKMHVILYLGDGRVVNITSNEGTFNKKTYDCFFKDNVKAVENETEIFADNLDLLAAQDYVKIYNNVKLDHTSGSLRADTIDYDFKTKDFKVSMFDNSKVKMKVIK